MVPGPLVVTAPVLIGRPGLLSGLSTMIPHAGLMTWEAGRESRTARPARRPSRWLPGPARLSFGEGEAASGSQRIGMAGARQPNLGSLAA